MKRIHMIIGVLVWICLSCYAYANPAGEEILRAIVKIQSVVPRDADSAGTLGTEREGNGVVIDSEGTILTMSYLVRDAESIEVVGPDAKIVNAKFVGYDPNTGFGILQTDQSLGVSPLDIGKSSTVKVGDPIMIAGYGGVETVQGARVISRKEFAGYWEYLLDEAIFTAPAYENFSGAALINTEGQLVGIGSLFTQVSMEGFGLLPCNVFVPIDLIKPILADLKTTGRSTKPQRPWLGINAEETHGRVFITRVTSGGPAEKAGLKPGEIILTVNGGEVTGLPDFYRKIWGVGIAGVQIPLTILKGAKIHELTVISADRYKYVKPKPRRDITL